MLAKQATEPVITHNENHNSQLIGYGIFRTARRDWITLDPITCYDSVRKVLRKSVIMGEL